MRPVFIGGCDRSGTTLLGSVLGAHTRCLCIPEMPFKFGIQHALEREGRDVSDVLKRVVNNWRFQIWGLAPGWESGIPPQSSAREIIEGIVKEYGKKVGKPAPQVWLDHTPQNIRHAQTLLDLFPEARMIHIVRDGRAVASSLMRVDWGPNEVQEAARFWVESLAHGFAAELLFGPERVMRVRYEDLVLNPGTTLKGLCSRLDISYEAEMSRGTGFKAPSYTESHHSLIGSAPNASRVNAWESELTLRQVEIFESVAAALLSCLGYPLQYGLAARRISRKERFASRIHDFYRKALNWHYARRRIRLGLAHR